MDHSSNRFDRIIAILIQLQSRKIVKAKDLADRFGVVLRTIYRDIKSLQNAGVPIIGEAGSGYSIMDGYRLPPVMFTIEEAGSFVTAEKLMARFTDATMNAHFATAMYKVKSVMRSDEKNRMEFLEAQIDITTSEFGFNKNIPNALQIIVDSMSLQQQLFLQYNSLYDSGSTERQIEVVGIFHENQYWYIYAWCHLREDYRQFRIDRIIQLKPTTINFYKTHASLQQLRKKDKKIVSTKVRIKVKKSAAPYLRYGREYYGFLYEKIQGDWVEMTFNTPDASMSFARWFLMFSDQAQIIEPESLKAAVRNLLNKSLKNQD